VEAFTELIGTMLFALLGGVADPGGTGRDGWPALGARPGARVRAASGLVGCQFALNLGAYLS